MEKINLDLHKKILRQEYYLRKLNDIQLKMEDISDRTPLLVTLPIGASVIDISVATSAFKNILQSLPQSQYEIPIISLVSVIIVFIELCLGYFVENKKSILPNILIMIVPLFVASEGIAEVHNRIESPLVAISYGIIFLGLALLSYIIHKEVFKRSENVLSSITYSVIKSQESRIQSKRERNEYEIKILLGENIDKDIVSYYAELDKQYDKIFEENFSKSKEYT